MNHQGSTHETIEFFGPCPEGGQGAVELLFNLGGNQYALEHTKIEPFPNQIKFDIRFVNLFSPFWIKSGIVAFQNPGNTG